MTPDDVVHLRRCIELAWEARRAGDEPFGSVLVGPDGTPLAEERNRITTLDDCTAHPELLLARWAARHLSPDDRARSTVYTSCEHCAMCAGAHFWAGVGRIVFACSGAQLVARLPAGVPALELSTRELFARGNRPVAVDGPCPELEDEALAVFDGMWA